LIDCLFVSDLHGSPERYALLFRAIEERPPAAVFLGGDLLPSSFAAVRAAGTTDGDFVDSLLAAGFDRLRERLGTDYPKVFLILGNDDGRAEESAVLEWAAEGLWCYAHGRSSDLAGHEVYGYSFIPPTPFRLKDWERYDVSRYVDPGCSSPEEGLRSVPVPAHELRYATIQGDLERLTGDRALERAVFLFHGPPYRTKLDRAALDDKTVDHVPLDVHVGSIAVRRFIERRQPWLTLHGHVHESARLSGDWRDCLGRTHMFTAAHDGPELALVRFDLENPAAARRELLAA
jgi:Icc-related predicted phosphoesterase